MFVKTFVPEDATRMRSAQARHTQRLLMVHHLVLQTQTAVSYYLNFARE
jgi:hypothetical protein